MMDGQVLWSTILSGALAVGGWVMKSIYEAIKSLEGDLSEHKIESAKTYSTKTDIARIEDKLDRVLDKLDRKADRE